MEDMVDPEDDVYPAQVVAIMDDHEDHKGQRDGKEHPVDPEYPPPDHHGKDDKQGRKLSTTMFKMQTAAMTAAAPHQPNWSHAKKIAGIEAMKRPMNGM
jgi:hypothetical protein